MKEKPFRYTVDIDTNKLVLDDKGGLIEYKHYENLEIEIKQLEKSQTSLKDEMNHLMANVNLAGCKVLIKDMAESLKEYRDELGNAEIHKKSCQQKNFGNPIEEYVCNCYIETDRNKVIHLIELADEIGSSKNKSKIQQFREDIRERDGVPEFSDWFNYLGDVIFKRGINIKICHKDNSVLNNYLMGEWNGYPDVKKYQIKLDSVKVYKYTDFDGNFYCNLIKDTQPPINKDNTMGHDPHNKIIICKNIDGGDEKRRCVLCSKPSESMYCKSCDDELVPKVYSDWFDYKGEVDFDTSIELDIDGYFVAAESNYGPADVLWDKVKRYRIKLDGVRVIEYEHRNNGHSVYMLHTGAEWRMDDERIIGHDPNNKIIIVKDSK